MNEKKGKQIVFPILLSSMQLPQTLRLKVCLCIHESITVFYLPSALGRFSYSTQGFVFKYGRGALNCSPERFKESRTQSDSYEHH